MNKKMTHKELVEFNNGLKKQIDQFVVIRDNLMQQNSALNVQNMKMKDTIYHLNRLNEKLIDLNSNANSVICSQAEMKADGL